MGKQKPKYNFTLGDALGGFDLDSDPNVRKVQQEQASRASQDTLSSTSITAPTSQFLQHDKEVYDDYLSPGKHYGTPEELDYQVAKNQSTLRQIVNGVGRLLPLTATKLAGIGTSAVDAAKYALGDKDVFNDNEVASSISSWEDEIKAAMPIYATQQYDQGSLLDQMGTAKFWADDLGDGVAFLAAQYLGTQALAAPISWLGKGASLASKAVGVESLIAKVPAAAKVANAIANNYTAVTAGLVNAGFSGAMQAQDTANQIKEGLAGKVNPVTGREYTQQEIQQIAGDKAANTFNATFLVHVLPAIWESKIFLGLNKAKLGDVREAIMGAVNRGEITMSQLLTGTGETALLKNPLKEFGKGVLEGAAIEGLWEENIEQSIQKYDIQEGLNGRNVGTGERTLGYAIGLLENLGVKDDAKAVVLGALLGGPMGGFSKFGTAKGFNEQMPSYLSSLQSSDQLYRDDVQSIYKTYPQDVVDSEGNVTAKKGSLVFDTEGQPIEDPEKLKNLTFQLVNQKSLWDKQTVATFTGNEDMAALNENVALSSAIYRELSLEPDGGNTQGALDFLKWRIKKQLEEQANEKYNKELTDAATLAGAEISSDGSPVENIQAQQAATEAKSDSAQFNAKDRADLTRVINDNMAKIDRISQSYNDSRVQAKRLTKIGQSSERSAFNKVAQKGLFYEATKRESYDEMIDRRQNQLKDPLADTDKIAKEIETLTALREDSLNKSKAYLNNTDEVYKAWSGPQARYGDLLKQSIEYSESSKNENDVNKRADSERKRDTALYTLNEMEAVEGFIPGQAPIFNEEISQVPASQRVKKPVGARNEFYYKAGEDYSKSQILNQKIDDYENGNTELTDVLNYAKESISFLDSETAKRLSELITAEREKLAAVQTQLASTDEYLYGDPDEDTGEEEPLGANPLYYELLTQQRELQANIAEATNVLMNKEAASEIDMINNEPQNVERALVRKNAEKYLDKGKYVLRNALDDQGNIREDYFDRDMINRAIQDATQMRNALEDRLAPGGDLEGVKGLNYLIKDANNQLNKLYDIRTQAELNRNNREGRQGTINKTEAESLISAMGYDPATGAIGSQAVFDSIDATLDNTLSNLLKDVAGLPAYHYEGVMAVIHKVQTKATDGQIGKILKELEAVRTSAQSVVSSMMSAKGINSVIIRGFKNNARQMFPHAWIAISSQSYDQGFDRVSNAKGSLFNNFAKTNDIDDLISKAEQLPDDTKALGMPKDKFLDLADAYKQAVASEKLAAMLTVKLKPIVQSELKSVEGEALVPTTQQDISIREGISWLQGTQKGTTPFKGWAFLRGIAGTGKTNVVLKWILNNSGIDKADVMATALTRTATDVVSESTGVSAATFEDVEMNEIPSNIKLLIIDEYGTIGEQRLAQFEEKIRNMRKAGQDIKVLMLGDPTQITPRLQNNNDTNNPVFNQYADNIKIINPLTVVYRSDISAVNEASDMFQDNNRPVGKITVRADKPVGSALAKGVHVSSASSQIPEIIANSIKEETETKAKPRTRAIIVGSIDEVAKYEGLGADVMTVFDAQSKTYEEVYVDINPRLFPDVSQYNTAMYTAASRAKEYSFLTYPEGENIVDTSITPEYNNNIDRLAESKTAFIQAKTQELAMMDGLDKGQTIKQVTKDPVVKEDVKNAGKSELDIEEEESEVEDDPEVVAEIPSSSEESDSPIDIEPEGATNPDTEGPAEPVTILPNIVGKREAVDNVDAEAYPALRDGEIGSSIGNPVAYIYNKEPNGENAVSIMAQKTDGSWVRVGKIFQEQINKDPRYADIKAKVVGMKPFHSNETDVLNGRGSGDTPYTGDQLKPFTVRTGKITRSQYLRFLYNGGISAGKLAADIGNVFREKFYHKSQADKSNKVRFKIFTETELTKDYDGTFRPIPGMPYAIIGSDGISYRNAMFVRLQPNRISSNDDQITTLRRLAQGIEKIEAMTGIQMGTNSFGDLIRVFRNSLEIVQEQTASGLVDTVKARTNYTRQEMQADAETMFDKDGRKSEPTFLKSVPDSQIQDVMNAIQDVAMQLYGIKKQEGKYTKAEVEALGEEYEAVPMKKKQTRNGEELFYANRKGSSRREYRKEARLDSSNGKASIAFNQIARANEFIGATRIRVQQYTGKTERRPSYTGKSLMNGEGGSSRLYEMMNLVAANIVAPKMIADGTIEADKGPGRKAAVAEVRDMVAKSGLDPMTYLTTQLTNLQDPAIDGQVTRILNKKETPSVTLATLKLLTDPQNFDSNGQHMTQDKFEITDGRTGSKSLKQTFIRKPLNLEAFNKLGQDPIANADALAGMVNSQFSSIANTEIDVDYETTQDNSVTTPINNPTPPVTEQHQSIDDKIAFLSSQIAAEKNPIKKLGLIKERKTLEDSRGRMPYDSNASRPGPGKRIDIEAAITELKRLIPYEVDNESVVFANKAMLAQLAKPGENLLGLFDKGKIYLDVNEDGQVYDQVLRHEVMHRIYNEFLSDKEKRALKSELDPANNMNTQQFDEYLADQFMSYQRAEPVTFGQRVRAIFDKLLNWFGFYYGHQPLMKAIFNGIEDGRFSKAIGGTSDVRRTFSNIQADFGNVANYKAAVNMVHGMVNDSVMQNSLSSSPITMKEAKEYTRQQLLNKRNNLTQDLNDFQEVLDTLDSSDPEQAEAIPELNSAISDTAAQLSTLNAITNEKVFTQLWKDMYPNYNFKEGERINSFEEYVEEQEPDDLNLAQLEEDRGASSLQDYTVQSDERNNEGKVTENVKNFLSFIFRKNGTRVNPRYAYLECLRILNGIASTQGNLQAQIAESAAFNGIDIRGNNDGARVANHLINLVNRATGETYTDDNKTTVELPRNVRFFGENTFYAKPEGSDISGISEDEITDDDTSIIITRNRGESTPTFISRISTEFGFDKAQLIGYFKQSQAQETMREVMSNFLSQREASPMIAEEARVGEMGSTNTVLRYFRAQMHGAERVMAVDVETAIKDKWLSIPASAWEQFSKATDPNEKVNTILKALDISKPTKEMNLTLAADIAANMEAFKNVVDQAYEGGKPKALVYIGGTEDADLEENQSERLADVEFLLGSEGTMINNITRMLSKNSADSRPSKYQSTDGRSRYIFHNSNQAIETMERVIDSTGKNIKKERGLPAHLKSAWAQFNPFLKGTLNRIHELVDHDGMRREWGEEFAKGYTDENNADNWARQFSYGFLSYIKSNTAKSDPTPKYVQWFYTISNRPRMVGAVVNALDRKGLKESAYSMLNQLIAQPEHSSVASYSRYKTINAEQLREAIRAIVGAPSAESYAKLSDASLKEKVIEKFLSNLNELASSVADKMIEEKMKLGDDVSKVVTIMKDKGLLDRSVDQLSGLKQTFDNVGYTKEQILPLVENWVANNYINGYFMNQLPVGNFNYFKSAIDLVKRMSGVFAPGTKGLVAQDGSFFMKPKFNMAVMNDPKMFSNELSEVFRDNDTALYNEAKNNLGKANQSGVRKEKGFDLADAQGFMLPSRAANIVSGMGKAYNAGAIFKPAHYEVAPRMINGEETYVPVMIKYSSAVLSDELVTKFPKLLALRSAMEDNEVDEVVFDSANKVGGPEVSRPVPGINDFNNTPFVFPEGSILELANENYRLQLNPKHDTYSDVANPTQLGYFLNVMGKVTPEAGAVNDPAATEVYTAIGNLIQHGLKKISAGLTRDGKVSKSQVQKTLTGAGNERIAEMLKDLSYNMPNIADKALIQIMNMFSKDTVKIKFKGGKFVLQSAYGFEMIKKGSAKYNALSETQQKAHDQNWSRYGELEREKIQGDARNLKYGTDKKGRMFAEVLIDKNYADKAKIGDFLLPDMMGYRIPSTELHSSIAIKVAGFYDSKGSNVIVAPPELVMQHGSDFDVDSLYVIGREVADKSLPDEFGIKSGDVPGYEWDSRLDKFVFNKNNWESQFPKWYQMAGTDRNLVNQIDKIYEMFQRNIVVENFLNVISNPVNIPRMTEPISVQVITDALEDLKLKDDRTIDLSNPLDNQDVYNSNFQGAKLVGVFANGMKALAYMLKAGRKDGTNIMYPFLQTTDENGAVIGGITLGDKTYAEFGEQFKDGKTVWQVLDALVNTSVDNVKEQQLYKINATNSTGNMYVAAQAMKIPLADTITFMLQPIGLLHSREGGKINNVKAALLAAYNNKAEVKLEKYADLLALSSSLQSPSLNSMRGWMNAPLNKLTEQEILKQVRMMPSFENLYNLGQDISTFSSSVGIVQDMPVMYEDIQMKADNWAKMGSTDADGNFVTNPNFSFNLDNLFEAQPNIREAYKVFTSAKYTAELSLTKHLPAVRTFVDEVIKDSGVRLSITKNVADMKNEVMNYLISSMYSDENREEKPFIYTYKGKERTVTGKQAWSQRFIQKLEKLKSENKANDVKNPFLNKIAIQNRFGMKTITFSVSSNSDYMDNLEMQEAFEMLPSDEIKNDFVKYAVMNYGLKFGVKNYSLFIPVQYLKSVDNHLRNIDKALRKNEISEDGKSVVSGELKNMKDNFLLRLAVNNTESLPFIPRNDRPGRPGIPALPTEGRSITVMENGQPVSKPALNGLDEYYYDRKYANPLEGDARKFSDDRFPLFIRAGENVALMRLNDPDSDFVYYQKLGYKNWEGGYDASNEALRGEYNTNKFFGAGVIPVPTGDINAERIEVRNPYLQPGSKVIVYGYSNESRDQGRTGVVVTADSFLGDGDRKIITIKDIKDEGLTDAQTDYVRRFSPIISMLRERFKIPMQVVTDGEMPVRGVKGMIRDGVVYLNMDKMTWDTPFHEVGHPLIEAIASRNAPWFKNLIKELNDSDRGKEITEQVKTAYPELSGESQTIESLVTLLGEYAADNLDTTPSLKTLVQRLFRAIGDLVRSILDKAGVVSLDTLSRDEMASITLNDLSQLLSNKDAKIELDLSGFVKLGRESRELNEIEQRLFEQGRVIFSCKA